VNRYDHHQGNDDYLQAGDLFRLMPPAEKKALIDNLATHMKGIPEHIARRQIEHFAKADRAYGHGVAEALEINLVEAQLLLAP
jgi:catalase